MGWGRGLVVLASFPLIFLFHFKKQNLLLSGFTRFTREMFSIRRKNKKKKRKNKKNFKHTYTKSPSILDICTLKKIKLKTKNK